MFFKELNWLVIPGGPCLSKRYLEHSLAKPFMNYKLNYYDSLCAPELNINYIPTINELVEQIFMIAKEKKFEKFGLITHSFGNHLAMESLKHPNNNISSIIMISPMPFVSQHVSGAFKKITANIPISVFKRIKELSKDKKNGAEIFELLFPYYGTKEVKSLPRIQFDSTLCDKILEQVGDYDHRDLLTDCNIPLACIWGDNDPFYIEKDLLKDKTILIDGLGHYPFIEDHIAFSKSIENVEKILQKQTYLSQ